MLARGFLRRINELLENRDDEELTRPEQRRYNALIRQLRELIRSNEDDASNSDSNGSDESASLSDSSQSIEDENIDVRIIYTISYMSPLIFIMFGVRYFIYYINGYIATKVD